jgi:UDP-N-acetylglucosamine acyltransferase
MSYIHPTAIVEDGARLGADVTVGAFSIVSREATLMDGVTLDANVIVRGRTTVGARTRIAAFAVIGGEAQDLSYKGEPTTVTIGPDCIVREHVTIHRGTARGRGATTIGSKCFFMIGSHVGHDCVVGDHVILTNQAMLGGHAQVGDYAILGALAGVQQRCRIGAHAFIGGLTGVTRDVVPFVMVTGRWTNLGGINVVGLARRGFDRATIHKLRAAYRLFFRPGGSRAERLQALVDEFGGVPAVDQFIDFIRAAGDRPLALPGRIGGHQTRDDGDDDERDYDGRGSDGA